MVWRVRVTCFVAMPMVAAVAGGPEKDWALRSHASGNAKKRSNRGAALKTSVGEKPVIPKSDAQHRYGVKAQAERKVQPGQSPTPEKYQGTSERYPWNYDGYERHVAFSARCGAHR